MINIKFFLVILGFFSLLHCKSKKATEKYSEIPSENKTENTLNAQSQITIKQGETLFLKNEKMNISFNDITEDSRCPTDVNCVWAGVAVADITVMGVATRPMNISVATSSFPNKGYSKNAVFNGYDISLVSVSPYPSKGNSEKDMSGNYQITLQIVKASENSSPNSTTKK